MPSTIQWEGKTLDVDWHLNELDRVECEESLYVFLQHAWRFIDPAPFKPGWVIGALAEHLEAVCDGEIRRLIINIPPRCSKSSICSVAFPAWVWAQEEDGPTSGASVPFLHASYGYNLSLRDSVKCRRLIKSTWYRKLWGHRFQITPEQDQKIRFQNSRGGERLITSIGSGVTGEGGQIIVVDDPNAADEVLSDAVIQSTNIDWWDGTMGTRLNDPKTGAFIVIQQRLGENDLTGHILEREPEDWVHLVLPMEYEPARSFVTFGDWKDPRKKEGELLWPERFGFPEVRALEKRLTKWKAAGQLQQRPEPAGGGIIKRDWWRTWPPGGEELGADGQPVRPLHFPPFHYILASLDSAFTQKTMNDPSALTIWGVFDGPTISQQVRLTAATSTDPALFARADIETSTQVMLVHAWANHLELHELVKRVHKFCTQFRVDKLLIENKANGLDVDSELRRLFSNQTNYAVQLNNKLKGASGQTNNPKLARLYSVQHLFEEGMIWAPDRPWAEQVLAQCGTFPNARHDDLVDTTSQALRHLRDIGMLVRGEERMSEAEDSMRYTGRPAPPLYPA